MTDRILDARYQLIELLGSGGMGEVWRCHDPRIGRDVAVKVLLDVRVTDESLARFDREARVAGSLASPFIVSVHDYGHGALDGRVVPYLVMQLVDGETLDQVMARELAMSRIPDVGRALRWTDQVCAALEVAHRVGVVHRDVKPGNVMTDRGGAAKVLDFGIARFVGEAQSRAGLTASGVVLGTAGYMSPEQGRGPGPRSPDRPVLGGLPSVLPADRAAAVRGRELHGRRLQACHRPTRAAQRVPPGPGPRDRCAGPRTTRQEARRATCGRCGGTKPSGAR